MQWFKVRGYAGLALLIGAGFAGLLQWYVRHQIEAADQSGGTWSSPLPDSVTDFMLRSSSTLQIFAAGLLGTVLLLSARPMRA